MNMTTKEQDFALVMETVGRKFQVSLDELSGPATEQRIADARHVVAAIWATCNTLQDTARRMNRARHYTVQNSRNRVAILAGDDPLFAERVTECLAEIRQKAPWVLGETKKCA